MAGKVIVVGGSLGGLFAANLLLRAGWDVHVYERAAEELQGRGAGIVTHPELFEALALAGIPAGESLGVQVQERVTLDTDGSRIAACRLPQTLTAWSRLYQTLRSGLPDARYHTGKHLVSFTQEAGGVEARFADGEAAKADLLVAADGIRSTVRQQLLPRLRPVYAGYLAWRGLVEESALSEQARRDVFPYFAFGLPPNEQMIAYPVAGRHNSVAPGQRRYNFVWYRPVDEEALRDMLIDGDGKLWADGIPPPLIRQELLDAARRDARRMLAPQFAELVEKTTALLFQPIHDLESPRLVFGRVTLLGDCAFVARPHCGMGVTKAAGDAVALAQALRDAASIESALERYEVRRLAFGREVVRHAQELGAYLEATARGRPPASGLTRTPEAVMANTAVPL
ncbi:FAD binding domain-containing protein [Variovorax sp. PBL-E5]|uniref:FAD binding domain-containing protein n=1 Tax=Variovorax sp. PBL-E5 TaxID=434014 RepID=UPI001319A4AA|nr:FAD binding domain-containing protein [Variovorax sp. PBL-E5]VTU25301.1 FAD-dependent urate hydroxylase [Variovorax sp. PBL-E5]